MNRCFNNAPTFSGWGTTPYSGHVAVPIRQDWEIVLDELIEYANRNNDIRISFDDLCKLFPKMTRRDVLTAAKVNRDNFRMEFTDVMNSDEPAYVSLTNSGYVHFSDWDDRHKKVIKEVLDAPSDFGLLSSIGKKLGLSNRIVEFHLRRINSSELYVSNSICDDKTYQIRDVDLLKHTFRGLP